MSKQKQFVRMGFLATLGLIFLFGFPLAANGQFTVVSTIPTDGATNVDTASTFQITFSAPLDTSVRFDYPPGLYLNLVLHPDSLAGEPDSVTLSPDLRTVYVHNPHLTPDTRYMFLIANAVSATQDSLSMPYLVTFTTGSSLPTATVLGTVSFPGIDVTSTAVVLFNAPLFTEEDVEAENATIVQTSMGDYTINYVPSGIYWPVAVYDYRIDAAGGLQPNVGGGMGLYDPNADGIPDSIIVSEGQQVSGIDISLFSLALVPVTARHHYPAVETSAQNWASDASLVMLASWEISPSGEASSWMYAYYSPALAAYQAWLTTGALVIPFEMDEPPDSNIALPTNWLDSDIVADSAEAHGGSDFRAKYSDATAQAFLTTMELPGSQLSYQKPQKAVKSLLSRWSTTGILSLPFQRRDEKSGGSFQKALSFQNYRAVWVFLYHSEAGEEQLFLLFDAITGEHIQPPQPAETTARFNLDVASQSAQSWASDAELVMLGTHQSNLTPTGEAMMWFFIYHSASQDSEQVFMASNAMLLAQGPIWEPPSKIALPVNWIDSDVAMDTAEAHGGNQYRADNQDVTVDGGVSRALFPGKPDSAVWQIQYRSSTADPLSIYIDAISGELITPDTIATYITARHRLQDVEQEAKKWAADAVLVHVGFASPMPPEGTSSGWSYIFYSSSQSAYRVFYALSAGPISSETISIRPPSNEALPDDWIDSDVATAAAEANGGSAYRSRNPDPIMGGTVSKNMLDYWGRPSQAVWRFGYASGTESTMFIFIDAASGAHLATKTDVATDARYNLEAADFSVPGFAADAKLTYVMNNTGSLDEQGRSSDSWLFSYCSATKGSFISFQIIAGQVVFVYPFGGGLGSQDPLPDNWINSSQAVNVAEAHGGSGFRASFSDTRVEGLLTKNYPKENYDIPPDQAVWRIQYNSAAADSYLVVLIDAVTSEFIQPTVGVETRNESRIIPENFSLNQNYPNPFNPETTIEYGLPRASHIEIIIFNLQGKKIATVIKNYQAAGFHQVEWDGNDEHGLPVTSGVYLYQLKAGDFTSVKKMLLLR